MNSNDKHNLEHNWIKYKVNQLMFSVRWDIIRILYSSNQNQLHTTSKSAKPQWLIAAWNL